MTGSPHPCWSGLCETLHSTQNTQRTGLPISSHSQENTLKPSIHLITKSQHLSLCSRNSGWYLQYLAECLPNHQKQLGDVLKSIRSRQVSSRSAWDYELWITERTQMWKTLTTFENCRASESEQNGPCWSFWWGFNLGQCFQSRCGNKHQLSLEECVLSDPEIPLLRVSAKAVTKGVQAESARRTGGGAGLFTSPSWKRTPALTAGSGITHEGSSNTKAQYEERKTRLQKCVHWNAKTIRMC